MKGISSGCRFGEEYKEAAFGLYYALGANRSIKRLQEALIKVCGKAPTTRTLEKWCSHDDWRKRIGTNDKCNISPELTELARAGALSQFRAKEELREFAGRIIRKADKELDAAKSYNPEQMLGVKRAVESAVCLIKEAEVLEGNVSDRIATEQTLTVEDKLSEAERIAGLLFAAAAKSNEQPQSIN